MQLIEMHSQVQWTFSGKAQQWRAVANWFFGLPDNLTFFCFFFFAGTVWQHICAFSYSIFRAAWLFGRFCRPCQVWKIGHRLYCLDEHTLADNDCKQVYYCWCCKLLLCIRELVWVFTRRTLFVNKHCEVMNHVEPLKSDNCCHSLCVCMLL